MYIYRLNNCTSTQVMVSTKMYIDTNELLF